MKVLLKKPYGESKGGDRGTEDCSGWCGGMVVWKSAESVLGLKRRLE